jgi:ribosomal protein S3
MYLSGRFKRKQRAGHWWFSKGKTPLNTIFAFVDYAFWTIVLPNSSITVKVWLYKSDDIVNKHYLKMYS